VAISKEQYNEFVNDKSSNTSKVKNNLDVTLVKQASVRSTKLVGTPEWDTYLSQVEAIISQTEDIFNHSRSMMESPKTINYEQMMQCKIVLSESKAIINVLKQVIQIPYIIIHERDRLGDVTSKIPLPEPPEFATKA